MMYPKKSYSRNHRKKKTGIRELDNKLWGIFSEYIRLRDADKFGYVKCVTCGKRMFWKGTGHAQAGHFISRRYKATKYDETNIHIQCDRCNGKQFLNGNIELYTEFMEEKYGAEHVRALRKKALAGGKLCEYQLQLMITEYREKVKKLKKEKGL